MGILDLPNTLFKDFDTITISAARHAPNNNGFVLVGITQNRGEEPSIQVYRSSQNTVLTLEPPSWREFSNQTMWRDLDVLGAQAMIFEAYKFLGIPVPENDPCPNTPKATTTSTSKHGTSKSGRIGRLLERMKSRTQTRPLPKR